MNEAHRRFHEWLSSGAEGDPPRDLAVHASVCDGCRQSIAAFDRLAGINPGLASMPAEPTGRERGGIATAARLLGATAFLFSAAILGVGVSQLIGVERNAGAVARATPTPDQNVLGGTATAQPSRDATSSSAEETLTPLGTPNPTAIPHPAPTPIPWRSTPRPIPTAVPAPSTSETGLPSSTPLPTDTATPVATETPIPTATPPLDSDGDGVTDADEVLYGSNPSDPNSTPENSFYAASTCTDLVDNDLDGNADALDPGCQ
jgi:thrombospondin type 3 repeat protein